MIPLIILPVHAEQKANWADEEIDLKVILKLSKLP